MRLEVVCKDRMGIAKEILTIMVKHGTNLRGIETDPSRNIFLNFPELEFSELQVLLPEIRRIDGVEDVRTVPYTPSERGSHELNTILRTLPDPVFSLDMRGRIVRLNEAAQLALRGDEDKLRGQSINQFVHGFSFQRWLDDEEIEPQATKVSVGQRSYLADILPILVDADVSSSPGNVLAGAVLLLKSTDRLGEQVNAYQKQSSDGFERIYGNSQQMKQVLAQSRKMAQLDAPLLIQGETGTGKELLARACHEFSFRGDGPFVALNCASLPDNVAESEMFGHGENAFEGAGEAQRGVLEIANGGTVFLDEIGEMSSSLQAKLLRFLQDGSFRRVGEEEEINVDVRVICATQKDLPDMVQKSEFREDLYYRLNVLCLVVPPLRERKSDILPLAERFIERFCAQTSRPSALVSKSCRDYMMQYPWPGNVRQLENALYRAISLLEGNELSAEDLQLPSYSSNFGYYDEVFEGSLEESVKRFESNLLRRLYPAYPSTRQLARKLGVSHTAIANKLREYGINKKSIT
ncbi:transcriptional regulator TyrR [Echinimonas agarilytica]|uniref:HTH-type transcriptional regulatory protein TyrR n=1 Tax=Echinimonas agarilytica TaxID=1215918 RepID=A0AA41W724_9GAMM|nr:transcriptional regulator TyrR [Echinimonas agarilytica]MCM2680014.1 transcriptional regulator TyrR [Echinimonas agarilytica]